MRSQTFTGKAILFAVLFFVLFSANTKGQSTSKPSDDYFTIENFYKVKWGFADEFINLWKTNHYPLLKKAKEKGDIIAIDAEKPKLHSGEDTRWDFKVSITYKTAKLAFDSDFTTPYKKLLYPDLDKLVKDEQHRFELLIAHWDVMIDKITLD